MFYKLYKQNRLWCVKLELVNMNRWFFTNGKLKNG